MTEDIKGKDRVKKQLRIEIGPLKCSAKTAHVDGKLLAETLISF